MEMIKVIIAATLLLISLNKGIAATTSELEDSGWTYLYFQSISFFSLTDNFDFSGFESESFEGTLVKSNNSESNHTLLIDHYGKNSTYSVPNRMLLHDIKINIIKERDSFNIVQVDQGMDEKGHIDYLMEFFNSNFIQKKGFSTGEWNTIVATTILGQRIKLEKELLNLILKVINFESTSDSNGSVMLSPATSNIDGYKTLEINVRLDGFIDLNNNIKGEDMELNFEQRFSKRGDKFLLLSSRLNMKGIYLLNGERVLGYLNSQLDKNPIPPPN